MNQPQQQSLDVKGKYYILNLAGGLGARIIQTCFIRSLITKRKKEKNSYPILVIDNTIIGQMASQVLSNQNVISVQVPESPNSYPHHPGLMTMQDVQRNTRFGLTLGERVIKTLAVGYGNY